MAAAGSRSCFGGCPVSMSQRPPDRRGGQRRCWASAIERYSRTGVLVRSWFQSVRDRIMARVGQPHAGIWSIRGALVAGFSVLIALWAFAGFELIRSLGDVEYRVMTEHDAFADAADTVSLIRRNVFEASINVRDALIDADPQAREDYRGELRQFHEAIEERMATYLRYV